MICRLNTMSTPKTLYELSLMAARDIVLEKENIPKEIYRDLQIKRIG